MGPLMGDPRALQLPPCPVPMPIQSPPTLYCDSRVTGALSPHPHGTINSTWEGLSCPGQHRLPRTLPIVGTQETFA